MEWPGIFSFRFSDNLGHLGRGACKKLNGDLRESGVKRMLYRRGRMCVFRRRRMGGQLKHAFFINAFFIDASIKNGQNI